MRDFLDSILAFIGSESLTDLEYSGIDLDSELLDQASFDALKSVLESRDSVGSQLDKLTYYYKAHGFEPSGSSATAVSNIFVGACI